MPSLGYASLSARGAETLGRGAADVEPPVVAEGGGQGRLNAAEPWPVWPEARSSMLGEARPRGAALTRPSRAPPATAKRWRCSTRPPSWFGTVLFRSSRG